jgi:THUMP domain-like/RNA cap guanine-N2 methyltransferase
MQNTEFEATDSALSFLLSTPGHALLDQLATAEPDELHALGLTTRLRKDLAPDIVAAALDVALLRRKARAKFARADEMFFTRESLEQASAEVVARHRAHRYHSYPAVADLCCGIGGDALALAIHADVLAVDRDMLRLRMALANAQAYGVDRHLHAVCADVNAWYVAPSLPIWADPARRAGGRRVFSPEAYHPPLSSLLPLAHRAPGAGIKLAPGVNYGELDALLGSTPYEVEILSVQGECREAVLWLGDLTTTSRRATLLPGGHTLTARSLTGPVPITPPGAYLYEPDAAVIRAHLVEHLAEDIDATKIDDQIAYLTSSTRVETPFAVPYQVMETMPFNLKALNRRLRELDVGELIIKKRGLPIDPEQFRHRLKYGPGSQTVAVVLTRVQNRPSVLICRPLS